MKEEREEDRKKGSVLLEVVFSLHYVLLPLLSISFARRSLFFLLLRCHLSASLPKQTHTHSTHTHTHTHNNIQIQTYAHKHIVTNINTVT